MSAAQPGMERIMKKIILASLLVGVSALSSEAQIARVFVSVGGNDLNDCLQPATACRTLNGGILKVDTGGEVILVDTGSYAGATITKSVKINVPSGNVAFSGLSITVNAPSATVVLRGLTLKALTPGSGTGVNILAASAVFIENCVIDGWSVGLDMQVAGELYIKDSTIRNNTSSGVRVIHASAIASADNSRFERNSTGFNLDLGKGAAVRSLFANNGFGVIFNNGFQTTGTMTLDQCDVSNNSVTGVALGGAILRVLNSTTTGNSEGWRQAGGTFESFGNNVLRGNTTNTTGTITTVAKQ